MRPPHLGQARTSISNARCMSLAHDQWRGVGCAAASSPFGLPGGKTRGGQGAIGHHAGAPARIGGQHSMVERDIDPGARGQGGQLLEQFETLEEEMPCPVRRGRLEREQNAAVAPELKPVLADRRAQRDSGTTARAARGHWRAPRHSRGGRSRRAARAGECWRRPTERPAPRPDATRGRRRGAPRRCVPGWRRC